MKLFARCHHKRKFLKDNRAVSPAISTVILTSAVIVLVLVAMVYAQNYLNVSVAQNEFSTNQQFMLTTGLQMDDVAWTVGRTQTVRYTSSFGKVAFDSQAINYSMEIDNGSGVFVPVPITLQSGIVLFNMPAKSYSLGNNYLQHIFPITNTSFLQQGPSAPVSYVYSIEKIPMSDGSFARVVIVPSIRMLSTYIGSQNYVEFYLPLLTNGTNRGLSQSVTMIGEHVTQYAKGGVTAVRFNATFPRASEGFNSGFFPFNNTLVSNQFTTTVTFPSSTVQFYVANVSVSLGLYS